MKKELFILQIIFVSLLIQSCKKDTQPQPIIDNYRMEIELTDNAPFGNVAAFFAFGNSTFPDSTDLTGAEGEGYLYLTPNPVYLERVLTYSAPASDDVFIWVISSGSTDNFYSAQVFKNDTSIFKAVGYVLNHERVKIN